MENARSVPRVTGRDPLSPDDAAADPPTPDERLSTTVESRVDPLRYLPPRGISEAEERAKGLRPVAAGLLRRSDGAVLLQHRDDDPTIVDSGKWSLFGGGIEPGEDQDTALVRELEEEIGLRPTDFEPFLTFPGRRAYYHVYLVRTDASVEDLDLQEGQGFAYVQPEAALASYDLSSSARVALEMLVVYLRFREREELGSNDLPG